MADEERGRRSCRGGRAEVRGGVDLLRNPVAISRPIRLDCVAETERGGVGGTSKTLEGKIHSLAYLDIFLLGECTDPLPPCLPATEEATQEISTIFLGKNG